MEYLWFHDFQILRQANRGALAVGEPSGNADSHRSSLRVWSAACEEQDLVSHLISMTSQPGPLVLCESFLVFSGAPFH